MDYEREDVLAKINLAIWQQEATTQPAEPGSAPFLFDCNGVRVVAQGDSWFDYLPGIDIIKWLKLTSGYRIKNFATPGDTLENMVYGTEIREGAWTRRPPEMEEVLDEIRRTQPAFFLFCGGGNDIAGRFGERLDAFLNHASANPADLLRSEFLEYSVNTLFKAAYESMIERVQQANPAIHILFHGYGRAIPTGKAVINLGNFRLIGPWLRPALTRKNILDPALQRRLIATIADRFNEMLMGLAAARPNVHFIDLRDSIRDDDWINETHLNALAYWRAATLFEAKMDALLPTSALAGHLRAKTTTLAAFQALEQSLENLSPTPLPCSSRGPARRSRV
ncbi:MAG: SGNH/GDSL hydrolase family protein [Pseudomonadota bacterium]